MLCWAAQHKGNPVGLPPSRDTIARLQGQVYTNKRCECLEMPITDTPGNTLEPVEADGIFTQVFVLVNTGALTCRQLPSKIFP